MIDTVLPSLLPLDIKWLLRLQEGFSGPEGVARFQMIVRTIDLQKGLSLSEAVQDGSGKEMVWVPEDLK
jgi:hypothetical protein